MELIKLLRAKSEVENPSLVDHIIETLKRAEQLRKFAEINKIEIEDGEKFFTALALAGLLHDMGKISYEFQKRVHDDQSEEWISLKEFLNPIRNVKVRHEILSALWASVLLPDNDKWAMWIRTALLLHHYNEFYIGEKDLAEIVYSYQDNVTAYLRFLKSKWEDFRQFFEDLFRETEKIETKIVKNAIRKIDISGKRVDELLELIENKGDLLEFAEFYSIDNENPDYEFMVFLGCLRRCDYSASGEIKIEHSENLRDIFSRMETEIKARFSESLWQVKVLEDANEKSGVLIAPTGSGKTEFSILWASRTGRKFIYTLPLRVALNDIYHRFSNYLKNREFLGLLHSTAFIEYVSEGRRFGETNVEKKITSASLLSNLVTLATPDQIFLTSLNYYGSDKVISTYPFSAVVLDEIQAYDPEMASIIIKTLNIVDKLGGKILIMTATLPPYFKPFFFKDEDAKVKIPNEFRLNFTTSELFETEKLKDEIKNYTLQRHKIKVVDDSLVEYIRNDENNQHEISVNKQVLRDYLNKLRESGKKSNFIVVNNVSKAIKIYEVLEEIRKNGELKENVFLLHSRLLEKVKGETIRKIKETLSKIKDDEYGTIVVATQIIEASVDLDFDGMLTEISPIDSQIQRWGRIYRKRDSKYDGEPNIYIFTKIDRGTTNVYKGDVAKLVLMETANVLKDFEGKVLSYEEERQMFDDLFNREVDGKKLNEMYIEEIVKNLEFLKYFSVEKKSQAQKIFRNIAGFQVVIPKLMEKYGEEWVKDLAGLLKNLENSDMQWKKLEEILGKSRWEIKKALYEFSVNVPIFYFEKIENRLQEFKGFYLLKVGDEDAVSIYKYGLDKFMKEKCHAKDEEDEIETMI